MSIPSPTDLTLRLSRWRLGIYIQFNVDTYQMHKNEYIKADA